MKSIIKKLEILVNNEKTGHQGFKNYTLNDIKYLLKYFGNPHKCIKTIHIAGTNGKGSVAHMLNSILIAARNKTGLYTSPHLVRINERIMINNMEIPMHRLAIYVDELFEVINREKKLHPTYFDALTLFAFRYFYEEMVDIAVIEVGLGGRLDSTNVISPLISIITDISMDHMNVLGNTIQEIAWEKAGIIKKKSLTITSNKNNKVMNIISKKANEASSELYSINKDFFIKNVKYDKDKLKFTFDFSMKFKDNTLKNKKKVINDYFSIKNIRFEIPGQFQIVNASLVITSSILLKKFGYIIKEHDIIKGLKNVRIPGRLQILTKNPPIIFDPAHNPAALKATLLEIKKKYPNKDYNVIISLMTDKKYSSMFKIIYKTLTQKIFYYELNDKRCFKLSEKKFNKDKSIYNNIRIADNIEDLIKIAAKSLKSNSLFFITGSFRLFTIAKKFSKSISIYSKMENIFPPSYPEPVLY